MGIDKVGSPLHIQHFEEFYTVGPNHACEILGLWDQGLLADMSRFDTGGSTAVGTLEQSS